MRIQGFKGPFVLMMLCTLPVVVGCETLDVMPGSGETAITTVVKDVYGRVGRGRMIFLGTDEEAAALQETMSRLAADLKVRVRPASEAEPAVDDSHPALTPLDPETGEVGVRISVGWFRVGERGYLHVGIGFARSGLDGATYEYVLKPVNGGWSVIEVRPGAVA